MYNMYALLKYIFFGPRMLFIYVSTRYMIMHHHSTNFFDKSYESSRNLKLILRN